MEKILEAAMVQKHGTSQYWKNNLIYIPRNGEIIVYDDLRKIKIGNGIDNLENLPFITSFQLENVNNDLLYNANFLAKEDNSFTLTGERDRMGIKYGDHYFIPYDTGSQMMANGNPLGGILCMASYLNQGVAYDSASNDDDDETKNRFHGLFRIPLEGESDDGIRDSMVCSDYVTCGLEGIDYYNSKIYNIGDNFSNQYKSRTFKNNITYKGNKSSLITTELAYIMAANNSLYELDYDRLSNVSMGDILFFSNNTSSSNTDKRYLHIHHAAMVVNVDCVNNHIYILESGIGSYSYFKKSYAIEDWRWPREKYSGPSYDEIYISPDSPNKNEKIYVGKPAWPNITPILANTFSTIPKESIVTPFYGKIRRHDEWESTDSNISTYIPAEGELIIYEHYNKVKNCDGVTPIKNLSFSDEVPKYYTLNEMEAITKHQTEEMWELEKNETFNAGDKIAYVFPRKIKIGNNSQTANTLLFNDELEEPETILLSISKEELKYRKGDMIIARFNSNVNQINPNNSLNIFTDFYVTGKKYKNDKVFEKILWRNLSVGDSQSTKISHKIPNNRVIIFFIDNDYDKIDISIRCRYEECENISQLFEITNGYLQFKNPISIKSSCDFDIYRLNNEQEGIGYPYNRVYDVYKALDEVMEKSNGRLTFTSISDVYDQDDDSDNIKKRYEDETDEHNKMRLYKFNSTPSYIAMGGYNVQTGALYQKPKAFVIAAQHGDERSNPKIIVDLLNKFLFDKDYAKIAGGFEWYIIPVVNIWGYNHNRRTLRLGSDMNRDFYDKPNDNNETGFKSAAARAIKDIYLNNKFDLFLDLHNYSSSGTQKHNKLGFVSIPNIHQDRNFEYEYFWRACDKAGQIAQDWLQNKTILSQQFYYNWGNYNDPLNKNNNSPSAANYIRGNPLFNDLENNPNQNPVFCSATVETDCRLKIITNSNQAFNLMAMNASKVYVEALIKELGEVVLDMLLPLYYYSKYDNLIQECEDLKVEVQQLRAAIMDISPSTIADIPDIILNGGNSLENF